MTEVAGKNPAARFSRLFRKAGVFLAKGQWPEALAVFRKMGDQRGMAECLTGLACVLGARGEAEQAARLFAGAEAAFEAQGTSPAPHNRADSDRLLAAVRASIDEAIFAAAWEEGRSMSLEQAIAFAMETPLSA